MYSVTEEPIGTAAAHRRADWLRDRPAFWKLLLFYAAYFGIGSLSQGLAIIPGVGIMFWPPVGILIATLLLNSKSAWPWFIVVAGLAELTCNAVWWHNPLPFALIYFSGNALESLTAAWLITRFSPKPFRFETFEQVAAFVVFGAGVAPLVSATIIATTDAIVGKHDFATAWQLVWLGDSTGMLISAPLTFVAIEAWRARKAVSTETVLEAAAVYLVLAVVCVLSLQGQLPTAYMIMPPLLWASVRFQLKGAASALALVTILTAIYTVYGHGEFAASGPERMQENIVMLQTFLGISAVSALFVAALSLQRQQALTKLSAANVELEERVAERTATLLESEQRLRLAQTAAGIGIHDYDFASGRFIWDERVMELWGVAPEDEITFETFTGRIHPDDRPAMQAALDKAIDPSGDGRYLVEYRLLKPRDGTYRWVHITGKATFRDGRPVSLIGTVHDITDRKEAEAEIREHQKRLERAVAERTKELGEAIEELREEIRQRKLMEKERRKLIGQLVKTQEDERRRIAQDLHDQLGQQLTALNLRIELALRLGKGDERVSKQLMEARTIMRRIDNDIDSLAWQLRPAILDDDGFLPALRRYVEDWAERCGVEADFWAEDDFSDGVELGLETETNLYRITQEALNNIAKYAGATRVEVILKRRGDEAILLIQDDGIGFDSVGGRSRKSGNSMGLLGMRERAALMGGDFHIETAEQGGTTVFVKVPLSKGESTSAQTA